MMPSRSVRRTILQSRVLCASFRHVMKPESWKVENVVVYVRPRFLHHLSPPSRLRVGVRRPVGSMHRRTRTQEKKVSPGFESRDFAQLFSSRRIQFRGIYYPVKFYQRDISRDTVPTSRHLWLNPVILVDTIENTFLLSSFLNSDYYRQ